MTSGNMSRADEKLRNNVSQFKSFYQGYEIALFFDMFQKVRPINDWVNYNTMKIIFHYHTLNNDNLQEHFNQVYRKEPNDFQNNYTGFIFMSSQKLFYSLIREIIYQKEFQNFLINKFGNETKEKLMILYIFLRNFWIHNIESNFGIQHKDYNGTLNYMKKESIFCKSGELSLKIDYQPIINVNYYINFNDIEGKNIFEIFDIKSHLSTLHVFYNLCSMFEEWEGYD